MRTIAIVNRKGGVGKSTTTVNLSAALARDGHRVLAIDCDTQRASATTWMTPLDQQSTTDTPELADVLHDPKRIHQAISRATAAGVKIVKSSPRTTEVERELTTRGTMPIAIKRIVKEIGLAFDFVFLDCPPGLTGIVVSSLVACDEVIIPVTSRGMSLDAVVEVIELIREIVDGELRPSMPVIRALVTEYDARLNLAQAVREELLSQTALSESPLKMFDTIIRRNERLAECYGARQSIFEVDPRANGAIDYAALALEVVKQNG
jgi:chromosome partitioning protein